MIRMILWIGKINMERVNAKSFNTFVQNIRSSFDYNNNNSFIHFRQFSIHSENHF